MSELTLFIKSGGALTKRISLDESGRIKSDGSACVMSRGMAVRAPVKDLPELAHFIGDLRHDQAIGLGRLRHDLPDEVEIVTKSKLNGNPNVIARTNEFIGFQQGAQAFALLDFDTKGMPPAVRAALDDCGGFWGALVKVMPALSEVGRVFRYSTSAGLYREDTDERLPGSDGVHVYIAVQDGEDIGRFLRVLHERCWLAGFGWHMVGAGGQILDRSIVDRMVGAPERLVFEGPPVLVPPLQQDQNARRPIAVDGNMLDTLTACPPLTVAEKAKLRVVKAREEHNLAGQSAKVREEFVTGQAKRMTDRCPGMTMWIARNLILRLCEGVLLPDIELPFDDESLAGCTVRNVLADPERFEGATLADPIEGRSYGVTKAKVMLRADGTPWINSFAHGRTVYELRFDAKSVRQLIEQADACEVVTTFVNVSALADLELNEREELRNLVSSRSGTNKRTIDTMIKDAEKAKKHKAKEDARKERLAERQDPRPPIRSPSIDDPWIPVNKTIDALVADGPSHALRLRDIDNMVAAMTLFQFPQTRAFSHANKGDNDDRATSAGTMGDQKAQRNGSC